MTAKYRDLLSRFINREITAPEFQSLYFTVFKNDGDQVPGTKFKILDRLFADVDDYTADPKLRERAGGLDDEELRTCAREAYRKLYETSE
ncbi:colicin immunity domain-containing protein [Mycobacterium simiae]|nr:colicin immunity domain-containing protein [Mycobacterium simiae]